MRTFIFALAIASALGVPKGVRHHLPGRLGYHDVDDVVPGRYAYTVSIQSDYQSVRPHMCTGAIYDPTTIITTAFCMTTHFEGGHRQNFTHPSHLKVVAGIINLYGDEKDYSQERMVEAIVVHQNYSDIDEDNYGNPLLHPTYVNDIALLKLTTPLLFDDYVNSIPLPDSVYSAWEAPGIATGWSLGYPRNDNLQKVYLQIPCDDTYGWPILDSMICAGGDGEGISGLDYGAPMACNHIGKGNSQIFQLCGIASWQFEVAAKSMPAIFTNIAYYRDWIIENAA